MNTITATTQSTVENRQLVILIQQSLSYEVGDPRVKLNMKWNRYNHFQTAYWNHLIALSQFYSLSFGCILDTMSELINDVTRYCSVTDWVTVLFPSYETQNIPSFVKFLYEINSKYPRIHMCPTPEPVQAALSVYVWRWGSWHHLCQTAWLQTHLGWAPRPGDPITDLIQLLSSRLRQLRGSHVDMYWSRCRISSDYDLGQGKPSWKERPNYLI